MSTEPGTFGAELVRTLLTHAPRPADGEITTILIALHDMVEAWSRAARPDNEDPIDDLVDPLYALLREYRPVSLAGVEAMLDFTLRDLRQDGLASGPCGYINTLLSSVRALRRLEADRRSRDGIPLLRLSGPRVSTGRDV
ncbi:MAG: hypothetical protein GVY13_08950 [Alphaproteobacteria bacterium]|jgi:hypothetical protein|nr:hypothetical protein [Alphaproteobacteria bacterium]